MTIFDEICLTKTSLHNIYDRSISTNNYDENLCRSKIFDENIVDGTFLTKIFRRNVSEENIDDEIL